MPRTDPPRKGWPFGHHDYEIAFGRLDGSREVDVRARLARPLVVGEIYTFGRLGRFYDLVVSEITLTAGVGWCARCKVIDVEST